MMILKVGKNHYKIIKNLHDCGEKLLQGKAIGAEIRKIDADGFLEFSFEEVVIKYK